MKKKILSLLLVLCLSFGVIAGMTACIEEDKTNCTHEWKDPTCDAPKTCTKCGSTEGEAYGHAYTGGVCIFCGAKDASAPGAHVHSYTENVTQAATCTSAGSKTLTCSCGDVQVVTIRASHNYVSGTCTICNDTATKEEIIAGTFENISIAELIDEIKIQYNQMPTIDFGKILGYFDLYASVPTYNVDASVKGGYVTVGSEGELVYIGFKDGNMIVVSDGKVIDAENIIPPVEDIPVEDIPFEDVDQLFDMIKEYVGTVLSSLPKVEASDLTYEDGWYLVSNEYNKSLVSAIAEMLYPLFAEDTPDAPTMEDVTEIINSVFETVDFKFGFAMDGDHINGVKLSANIDMMDFVGEEGTVSVYGEYKLSADLKKLETAVFTAELTGKSGEDAIKAEITASMVPVYNDDGSYEINTSALFTASTNDITEFRFSAESGVDYNKNGMPVNTFVSSSWVVDGTLILDYEEEDTLEYDENGVPVKVSSDISLMVDEFPVNSTQVWISDGQGGGQYADVDAEAKVNLEFSFSADISEIENGNAILNFGFKMSTVNPTVVADPIVDENDNILVSAEQILGTLSPAERSELLDVSGSNVDFSLSFASEGGVGKLGFTMRDEDGFGQTLEIDVEVNSDKSKLPPRDVVNLIQNFNPADIGGGENKPGSTPGGTVSGTSETYNNVLAGFDKLLGENAGQKIYSTQDEFEDIPEGAALNAMCTLIYNDFSYMASVYQCADAKSYELMVAYARDDMGSDPDAAGWTLTELGEYVFILEMGDQKFN